jgi:sn-glycerol 3-phosphate transport system permease protein
MSSATGVYIFIMTIVQGLQYVFTPIKVITQGGPDNASSNAIYNVYQEAFTLYHTGYASAFAVVTMALFVILLIAEFKYVEKGIYYEN